MSDSRLLKLETVVQAVADNPPPMRRAWTEVWLDRIYIIGDALDPTSGRRGRLWWLFVITLYGTLAVPMLHFGYLRALQVAYGLDLILGLFSLSFVMGLAAETLRIRRTWAGQGDAHQVTLLTGISQRETLIECFSKPLQDMPE